MDAKGRRSFVTSAGAGPSVGNTVLGYVPKPFARLGTSLAVEYFGEGYPVTIVSIDRTRCSIRRIGGFAGERVRRTEVRIASIESRVLGYDVAETWGAAGPPAGRRRGSR